MPCVLSRWPHMQSHEYSKVCTTGIKEVSKIFHFQQVTQGLKNYINYNFSNIYCRYLILMNKCTWLEHPTCLPKKRVGLNLNSFCIHETMSMFVHIASTHARKRWRMFVYLAVIKHLFSWHLLACWIENEDDTWIVWASHLPLLWTQSMSSWAVMSYYTIPSSGH